MTRIARGFSVAICLGFVLYFSLLAFAEKRFDFWRHLAIVASFERDLLHPDHESMSDSRAAREVHTPYHLAVALGARALHISSFKALQFSGVSNAVLFTLSLLVLFLRYFSDRWRAAQASAIYLMLMLFLRFAGYAFSGETSFISLHLTNVYPAFFAISLLFFLYAMTDWILMRSRPALALCIAPALCFLLLVHPLTGSFALLQLLVQIGVHGWEGKHRRKHAAMVGGALGAVVLGVGMTLLWPYYSIFRWSGAAAYGAGELAQYDAGLWSTLAVYLLCAPVLYFALRQKRVRAVGILLVVGAGVHVFSYFSGMYFLSRYIFLASNYAFVLLTLACMQALPGVRILPGPKLFYRAIAAASLLTVLLSPETRDRVPASLATAAQTAKHPFRFEQQSAARFAMLREKLTERDVIVVSSATDFLQDQIAYWSGAKSVDNLFCFTHPQYRERLRAGRCVFSSCGDGGTRQRIFARYGVTAVVIAKADLDAGRVSPELLHQLKALVGEDAEFLVFRPAQLF